MPSKLKMTPFGFNLGVEQAVVCHVLWGGRQPEFPGARENPVPKSAKRCQTRKFVLRCTEVYGSALRGVLFYGARPEGPEKMPLHGPETVQFWMLYQALTTIVVCHGKEMVHFLVGRLKPAQSDL